MSDIDNEGFFEQSTEQEPVAKPMTASRAVYFMERFKHEEKLLGPNEQAALDFVIAMLEQPTEQEAVAWPLNTNDEVESLAKHCGWNNRHYMTPADYQIWCDRMREFARLAIPSQPQEAAPRQWVGLTVGETAEFVKTLERGNFLVAIQKIEAKLKEKNT